MFPNVSNVCLVLASYSQKMGVAEDVVSEMGISKTEHVSHLSQFPGYGSLHVIIRGLSGEWKTQSTVPLYTLVDDWLASMLLFINQAYLDWKENWEYDGPEISFWSYVRYIYQQERRLSPTAWTNTKALVNELGQHPERYGAIENMAKELNMQVVVRIIREFRSESRKLDDDIFVAEDE